LQWRLLWGIHTKICDQSETHRWSHVPAFGMPNDRDLSISTCGVDSRIWPTEILAAGSSWWYASRQYSFSLPE
jgi:hypothetical protein